MKFRFLHTNASILTAVATLGILVAAHSSIALELSDVAPVSQIDPVGGATIKHGNPAWDSQFKAAEGQLFSRISKADIEKKFGVQVLNFETPEGFPAASHAIRADGELFQAVGSTLPFSAKDAITRISTKAGVSISVEARTINKTDFTLNPLGRDHSVFLVRDREANDVMTSGVQGIASGPHWTSSGATGVYLVFDRDLADFAVTSSSAGGVTPLVVLFDAQGGVLASYHIGLGLKSPLYFGVSAETKNIRSVWIGQLHGSNGVIVDDVAFVPAATSTASTAAAQPDDTKYKSQLEVRDAPLARSASNAYRILFVGNSITRHGTSDQIREQLGWDHVAGMAASTEDKDFVHLLAARIQGTMPERKVEIYFYSQAKPDQSLSPNPYKGIASQAYVIEAAKKQFRPHLVVIQGGEHERQEMGADFVREHYTKLVTAFNDQTPRPQVICAGVWQPGDAANGVDYYQEGKAYWSATLERVIREVCEANGIAYASVREFATDPSCRGWGTSGGVQWHPNDKGMEGYARVLFEAFQKAQLNRTK